MTICPFIIMSVCLSVCTLPLCLPACLTVCQACLPTCLPVCLPTCLSVCQFVCLYVCMYVRLCVCVPNLVSIKLQYFAVLILFDEYLYNKKSVFYLRQALYIYFDLYGTYLLLLNWTAEFPRMVRPIEQAPIHPSLEEVAVCAGHKVLMVVDLYFTACW